MEENTTTFSNMGNILAEKIKLTDEICHIHHTNKVTAFGRPPICLECGKEKREAEDKKMVEQAVKELKERDSKGWLTRNSIFLDKTLLTACFDNFDTVDPETTKNKENALKIARMYFKGETFNTILTGKPGTGKSHLAMAMLKAINEHSNPLKRCLFVSIDELMRRIKDSFNNPQSHYTERRMTDILIKADVLVIDDLGAETGAITSDKQATDFTVRTLYAVINGRMDKPTIFTTNLNSREIAQMYDSKLISRMFRGAEGHIITFKETKDKRVNIEF